MSNSVGTVTSDTATITVVLPSQISRISNVSVRATLGGSQTLIAGFTMQGGSKPVLVRVIGPSLAQFGVTGAMADPKLVLFKNASQLEVNDNWGGSTLLSSAFASVGAFALSLTSADSAILRPIEGGHTAHITGTTAGVVLVEAYDSDTNLAPRFTNISARNRVGTGGNILIAGFTVAGQGDKNILIRAIGSQLADFGVVGSLTDPKLEIYNSAGIKIAENDSWALSLRSAFVSVGAFPLTEGSKDAAVSIALPQGGYTAQVSGVSGGVGEALVEIYELP